MNSVIESCRHITAYELIQGVIGLDFSSLPCVTLKGSTASYKRLFERNLGGEWDNISKGEWLERNLDDMIFSYGSSLFTGVTSTPKGVRSFIRVSKQSGYTAMVTNNER